jgi:hypothetical protein
MSGTISATLASLIAAGVGVAGIGTGLYESKASSDASTLAQNQDKAQLSQQQTAAANQANLTKKEAVLGAQGNAQAQTGGSLTDSGTASLTDLLAGYPGYQGGSASTGTGIGPSGVSATGTAPPAGTGSSGTPDISAILAALRGQPGGSGGSGSSSLTGGNWQTQPAQPQTYQELANPPV